MIDRINEPVTVGAVFGQKSLIRPIWFLWRKREYRIAKITYTWMDREGQAKRYHFAVTDGGNLFELCYHTEKLTWQLETITQEE
jgi:hypothetical protein